MFIKECSRAFASYGKAIGLVTTHKLWSIFLWSMVVYGLILGLGFYGIYQGIHTLSNQILYSSFVEKWSEYKAIAWIFTIISWGIYAASFVVFFSFYKFVLLALASPFYSYVSEKTASILSGKQFTFNAQQLLQDVLRGITVSARNFVKQFGFTLLLLLLSFIPIIGIVTAALFILLDSYYYGLSMLDYSCERQKWTAKQSVIFIKQHKGLAIGNGLVFYGLFLIPIIGVIIGAPLSAIAAEISMQDALED